LGSEAHTLIKRAALADAVEFRSGKGLAEWKAQIAEVQSDAKLPERRGQE
jgi:hypothetical protein